MRNGRKGEGWTTAVIWMAVALVVVVVGGGMILPMFSKGFSSGKHRRVNCAGNLKQIGLALIIYAGDDPKDGCFPSGGDFELLNTGHYLTDGKVYQCPTAAKPNTLARESNYVYLGRGLKDTNANSTRVILAHDRIGNHSNWVNCIYLDGHAKGSSSKATTWAEFRAEREAAGDIIANEPLGRRVAPDVLPNYQRALEGE